MYKYEPVAITLKGRKNNKMRIKSVTTDQHHQGRLTMPSYSCIHCDMKLPKSQQTQPQDSCVASKKDTQTDHQKYLYVYNIRPTS